MHITVCNLIASHRFIIPTKKSCFLCWYLDWCIEREILRVIDVCRSFAEATRFELWMSWYQRVASSDNTRFIQSLNMATVSPLAPPWRRQWMTSLFEFGFESHCNISNYRINWIPCSLIYLVFSLFIENFASRAQVFRAKPILVFPKKKTQVNLGGFLPTDTYDDKS